MVGRSGGIIECVDEITLATWSSIVTGLATLVLAIAAICQSRATGKQIDLGERQAKVAEDQANVAKEQLKISLESTKTAAKVHRESVRGRVDQEAPQVVALLESVQPPLFDIQRSGAPQATELPLLDSESLERAIPAVGHQFVFDRDRSTFLWFYGRGLLVNEGRSSARVRLTGAQGGTQFVEGTSELAGGEPVGLPQMDGGPSSFSILPPGGRALFEWSGGHTVGEWADAVEHQGVPAPTGSIWFWVEVFDMRSMGVIDTLMMHFRPEVVHRVPGAQGTWEVGSQGSFGAIYRLPTVRGYKHEGAGYADTSQMLEYHGQGDPKT